MKKKLALLLAVMLLPLSAGCGKKELPPEEPKNEIQTAFRLEQCGLAYTVPDEWAKAENTNLIPASYAEADGEIYAKIRYNYAPDESMADLNNPDSTVPVEELMTPLVELLVVKEAHLESPEVQTELALFQAVEELPQQENFHFYCLSNYSGGISHFSEGAQKTFRELESHLPKFKNSIETFLPDESAVRAAAEEDSQYLNFISTTLEGDAVSSTVFYDYDLTVVNFWASYCYPDINELETLEKFSQDLKKAHANVNFIQIIIDTPDEDAEQTVAKAYEEAGVTFLSIMPDKNMAGWIIKHIEGLPTTIFVDKTGKPLSQQIQGIQSADYYMETTETVLKTLAQ